MANQAPSSKETKSSPVDMDPSTNEKIWKEPRTAAEYEKKEELQAPELSAIKLVIPHGNKLPAILDIGVGGGRTAKHLIGMAERYVGVDYSDVMVDACKKRFLQFTNAEFIRLDARDLSMFPDGTFDLVIFSYNGIDNLDREGREKALQEMKRVTKNDGYVLFSSHNTRNIPKLYSFNGLTISPAVLIYRISHYFKMRRVNGPMDAYLGKDLVAIRDGSFKFRLKQLYISPSLQVKQLLDMGLTDVKVFSYPVGNLLPKEQVDQVDDPWLYYLSRVKK
jgi:SAM-dependent methyltransferase